MSSDFNFQETMFEYVEQIKELLSPQIWKNVLLDCSKNEILTLWFVYRNHEVNMSMIAEYVNIPLNTATGIVSRLEKKDYVIRKRSIEDKRVVTIQLGKAGADIMNDMVAEVVYYGQKVMESVSSEEIKAVVHIMDQLKKVLSEEHKKERKREVRKIIIE